MRLGYFDELPLRAFQPIGKRMALWGKSDPPPAPDYAGAANATAAGNLEATRAAAAANRVNQITPYGNLTYTHGSPASTSTPNPALAGTPWANWNWGAGTSALSPDEGWTATQTLTPAQQGILDSTNKLNQGLMDTAGKGLNYANDVLSKPGVDTSKLPQVGINPGQSYQDAMMARQMPQIEQDRGSLTQQLANQGITQGTAAWDNAWRQQNQRENDLRNGATVGGFQTGLAANQTGFQQQSYNQMQPVNLINALRTGSQVQNPNFVNVPQQQATAGPDLLGAANASYNSQLGNVNAQNAASGNFMGGLFGLGASALGAPSTSLAGGFFGSDRAIKQNIRHVSMRVDGLNIYEFEYKPEYQATWGAGKHIGVMADEVEDIMPEAVLTHPGGYKMVNYAMIGGF